MLLKAWGRLAAKTAYALSLLQFPATPRTKLTSSGHASHFMFALIGKLGAFGAVQCIWNDFGCHVERETYVLWLFGVQSGIADSNGRH